jgi:site-specific recombinase XerD
MLEQGAPTATVARIVGHRTLATTEKYLSELRLGQRAVIDRHGERRFGT